LFTPFKVRGCSFSGPHRVYLVSDNLVPGPPVTLSSLLSPQTLFVASRPLGRSSNVVGLEARRAAPPTPTLDSLPCSCILIENLKEQKGAGMPQDRGSISYTDYVKGIDRLKPEEQLNLLGIISSRLKKTITRRIKPTTILELEGLGAGEWKGIDAQEYVRKEREAWD
jgi:hypothetical protein